MGSGSSKDEAARAAEASSSSFSSSSSDNPSTGRSRMGKLVCVFNSYSCFGLSTSSISTDDLPDVEMDERSKGTTCISPIVSNSVGGNPECVEMASRALQNKVPSLPSSDGNQDREEHDRTLPKDLGGNSSVSSSVIGGTSSSSGRFRSHFSFIPGGTNFRLNRTASLGSSHAQPLFPAVTYLPIGTRDNMETSSSQGVGVCTEAEATVQQYPRNLLESNATAVRPSYRRIGPQEALEGSIQFSRTLSVGRLRDRVLRRTALSEGLFSPTFLEDGSLAHYRQGSGRRLLTGVRRTSLRRNNEVVPDSSANLPSETISSLDINGDPPSDVNHCRVRDLLEHRSVFFERRRRIRSQVRALQRLDNRFESLSGHDRSCILSGRHRSGRCTCRTNNRASNPDNVTGTRASISRIVMLAEALFEVLDEIHQQSVVLSSGPSFSSIGSVPAPKEVVECIPIKMYSKPSKLENEEDGQCYICLVEYEEGDCLRVLPCKHEFHRSCVDKWLKEIHRVCPLCRGDVCSLDASGKSLIE